jgi:HAD superfamily hydrolase (TIGR01548 family)
VLLFDIDGVLIDVSESYRGAIRQTVQLYLEAVMRLSPYHGELVSREDVAAFKLAGGFNNDWDLATGILKYFIAMLEAVPETQPPPQTSAEIIAFLRQEGKHINTSVGALWQRKDILAFTRGVNTAGGGLAAVWKILRERNDHLLFAQGDPRGTNLVKRIFEEIYLGEALFVREYSEAPIVHQGAGLIHRERLIVNQQALAELGRRVTLGIATGRPRNQATYALKAAGILNQFRSLVTHEDVAEAEQKILAEAGKRIGLGKPHPFTLLEAVRRVTRERVRCAYLGDTPDDIRAANAAKAEMDFVSIGCLAVAEDKAAMRREFEQVGVDIIVSHPDELLDLINNK